MIYKRFRKLLQSLAPRKLSCDWKWATATGLYRKIPLCFTCCSRNKSIIHKCLFKFDRIWTCCNHFRFARVFWKLYNSRSYKWTHSILNNERRRFNASVVQFHWYWTNYNIYDSKWRYCTKNDESKRFYASFRKFDRNWTYFNHFPFARVSWKLYISRSFKWTYSIQNDDYQKISGVPQVN